jgi:dihydrolipoamide dehydrogenase
MYYDIIIIGSGPGGYVAAIRAAQLGKKVAVVEKSEIGGICLNWGCIPTKALLKSADVYTHAQHAASYGVSISGSIDADLPAMVQRSRGVAENMSKGVQFLFKKWGIIVHQGFGTLKDSKTVLVSNENEVVELSADYIILATGARARELPHIKIDGTKIIGYRQAMTLPNKPKSMVVIGSGAIGSEFAFFYQSIGTEVTLVEFLDNIVPLEDEEASKNLARAFKKIKMNVMTSSSVTQVDTSGELCEVSIETKKGEVKVSAEVVLSAVGVQTNLENLGLQEIGIVVEKGKVVVDDYYRTNVEGVYAIGDIVHGPALAHVASHEAIICVEKICGLAHVETLDYQNIPACTYTNPEVASVGLSEKAALEQGFELKVGKFPFKASGKATAAGNNDGFIKMIFDAKTNLLLGCSMVGDHVTEMIEEAVIIRKAKLKGHDIIKTIHPHPTMSEAVMEAAAAAYGEAIHIV